MHVEGHLRRNRFVLKMLGKGHLDQKKNGAPGVSRSPATFFLLGRENYAEGEDFARNGSSAAGKMPALHGRCVRAFCLLLLSGTDSGGLTLLRLLCLT